jgi:excinuclease ABC subunit C
VKGLFTRFVFTGFGPSLLRTSSEIPPLAVVRGQRPGRLRAKVRGDAPRLPGVYGMIDDRGELVYVGKAKDLRARLLSYFRPKSRDPKAGKIVQETRLLAWEVVPDEFAALLRELELIRRWQPRFNVQGQPRQRRRTYLCLGRQPAPYVFLSSRVPATAFANFGPIPAGQQALEAVRRINDWFQLRDCPQPQEMVFADQQELFPLPRAPGCLRHEIGACLAPCAAACTRSGYKDQVAAALAFLRGEDRAPVETLERDMLAASAALQFERAAALRDKLEVLKWLSDALRRLQQAARHSFVYPVAGHDGRERWYLIHRGRVHLSLARPHDETSQHDAVTALDAVYCKSGVVDGPPALEEIDGVLLVAAWFRRHGDERQRLLEPQALLTELTAPAAQVW